MRSLLAAILILACAPPVRAEADHAAIAEASLTQVIRPGYAAFRDAAQGLQSNVAALCDAPSSAALAGSREAFAEVVRAWSEVEIFRFGPIQEEHGFERVFFWPDPKGLGLKQVRDVLAKQDARATKPEELARKSVAVQGLPAIEYLLFGSDADTLAAPGKRHFRCAFALAAATNVARIAASVVEAWREGSAGETSLLSPTPADPRYHTPKEVTLELFKAFTSGIELVRDQKLGKPLGAGPEQARPRLAAFWHSGLTFDNAAGNLAGARALFAQGGFANVVASESAGVESSVLFDLNHSIDVLRGIDVPVERAVESEDLRAKIEAVRIALKSARNTGGDLISRGAGLAFGFNAMDGD